MKPLRKIGILIASAILTIMGLSSCRSMFHPLEYGTPAPPQNEVKDY